MLQPRISVKDRVRSINSQHAEASLNLPRPDLNILSPSRLPRKVTLSASNPSPAPSATVELQAGSSRQHGVSPSESIKRRGDAFIQNGGQRVYSPDRRPITELEAGISLRPQTPREPATAAPSVEPPEPERPSRERHIVDIYADQDFHEAFGRRQTQKFAHPAAHGEHLPESHVAAIDARLAGAIGLHAGGTHPHHPEHHDQPGSTPGKPCPHHDHEPADRAPLLTADLGTQQRAEPLQAGRQPARESDVVQPGLDARIRLQPQFERQYDRCPYEEQERQGQALPNHECSRHVRRQPIVQVELGDSRWASVPLRSEVGFDRGPLLDAKVDLPALPANAVSEEATQRSHEAAETGHQRPPDARGGLGVRLEDPAPLERFADRMPLVDANVGLTKPLDPRQGVQTPRGQAYVQIELDSDPDHYPDYRSRPQLRRREPELLGDTLNVRVAEAVPLQQLEGRLPLLDAEFGLNMSSDPRPVVEEHDRREADVRVELDPEANRVLQYDAHPRQQRMDPEAPRDGLDVRIGAEDPLDLLPSRHPRIDASARLDIPFDATPSIQEQQRSEADVRLVLGHDDERAVQYDDRPRQQSFVPSGPRVGLGARIEIPKGTLTERPEAEQVPRPSRRDGGSRPQELDARIDLQLPASVRWDVPAAAPLTADLELGRDRRRLSSTRSSETRESPFLRATAGGEPLRSARTIRRGASRSSADPGLDASVRLPGLVNSERQLAEEPRSNQLEERHQVQRQFEQGPRRETGLDASLRALDPDTTVQARLGDISLDRVQDVLQFKRRPRDAERLDASVRLSGPELLAGSIQQGDSSRRNQEYQDAAVEISRPVLIDSEVLQSERWGQYAQPSEASVRFMDSQLAAGSSVDARLSGRPQDDSSSDRHLRNNQLAEDIVRVSAPGLLAQEQLGNGIPDQTQDARHLEHVLRHEVPSDSSLGFPAPESRARPIHESPSDFAAFPQRSERNAERSSNMGLRLDLGVKGYDYQHYHVSSLGDRQASTRRDQPLVDAQVEAGTDQLPLAASREDVRLELGRRESERPEPSKVDIEERLPRRASRGLTNVMQLPDRGRYGLAEEVAVRLPLSTAAAADLGVLDDRFQHQRPDDVREDLRSYEELDPGLLSRSHAESQQDHRRSQILDERPLFLGNVETLPSLMAVPIPPGEADVAYQMTQQSPRLGHVGGHPNHNEPVSINLDIIRAILAASCEHRQTLASCNVCLPQPLRVDSAQGGSRETVGISADFTADLPAQLAAEIDPELEEACGRGGQESSIVIRLEAEAQLEGEARHIRSGRRPHKPRHRAGALGHPEQCQQVVERGHSDTVSKDERQVSGEPAGLAQVQTSAGSASGRGMCHTCLEIHAVNEACKLPEPPRLHPDCRHTGRCQELYSIAAATFGLQNARPQAQFVLLGSAPSFRSCSHVQDIPLPAPTVTFTAHGCTDASQCLVCLPHVATTAVPGSPSLQFGEPSGESAFDPRGHLQDAGPLPEASLSLALPSGPQSQIQSTIQQAAESPADGPGQPHTHPTHDHLTRQTQHSRPRRVRWEECGPLKATRNHGTTSVVVTGGRVPETEISISPDDKDIYHTEQLSIPGLGQVQASPAVLASILDRLPEQVALELTHPASKVLKQDASTAHERRRENPAQEDVAALLAASVESRPDETQQLFESPQPIDLQQRPESATEIPSTRARVQRPSLQDALSLFMPSARVESPMLQEAAVRIEVNEQRRPAAEQSTAPAQSEVATSITVNEADLPGIEASLRGRGLDVELVTQAPDRREVHRRCTKEQLQEPSLASPAVRLDAELRRTTGKGRTTDEVHDDCRCGAQERADRCCAIAADLEEQNKGLRESLQSILDASNEQQLEVRRTVADLTRGLRNSVRGSVEEATLVDRLIEQIESFAKVGWGLNFNRLPAVTSEEAKDEQERRAEAFSPPEPLMPSPLNPRRRPSVPSRRSSYYTGMREEASRQDETQACGVHLSLPNGEERWLRQCHITIQPWQECRRATREAMSSGSETVHNIISSYTSRSCCQSEGSKRRSSGRRQEEF